MNVSKTEVDHALVDVRKAFRLLHDYQRAALDAAKYIGTQLGLPYAGGYQHFSDHASPRDAGGSLDNCAWDWLNLMFYEFHFQLKEQNGKYTNLSIWLLSDTGYFISDDRALDKTDINTFAPVDKAETKVGFLLYRNWGSKYYEQLRDTPENFRRFIKNNGELPALLKDEGVIGKCCDFSRISDDKSADEVIDELVFLTRGSYELKRASKAV